MFDFNQEVYDLEKTLMKDENKKAWTLGRVAVMALLRAEQGVSEEDQLKRFKLAEKIADAMEPIKLTDKETVLLRGQVQKLQTPIFMGRMAKELDKYDEGPKEVKDGVAQASAA